MASAYTDPYEVLSVPRSVTRKDLKDIYEKLLLERLSDEASDAKFEDCKHITAAYTRITEDIDAREGLKGNESRCESGADSSTDLRNDRVTLLCIFRLLEKERRRERRERKEIRPVLDMLGKIMEGNEKQMREINERIDRLAAAMQGESEEVLGVVPHDLGPQDIPEPG